MSIQMASNELSVKARLETLKRIDLPDDVATRQSLISRLRRLDDKDSWSSFFDVYWRLIYSAGRDAGLSNDESEELVQETVISVCNTIDKFKYDRNRGSFRSWLFQLTAWRIKDQLRRRGRIQFVPLVARDLDEETCQEGADEPMIPAELESNWNMEWEANLLSAAIDRVRRRFDPKQFQMFELAVLKEWPIERIRSFLKVSAARIYVSKYRVVALVKSEVKHLKTKCF
jgi:RNA polymerase sigma-70 factor (ECF subfamily)